MTCFGQGGISNNYLVVDNLLKWKLKHKIQILAITDLSLYVIMVSIDVALFCKSEENVGMQCTR